MAAMPNIGFFVKNLESRYVYNNDFHRIRYDWIKADDLIGKRAPKSRWEGPNRSVSSTSTCLVNDLTGLNRGQLVE